MTVDHWNRCDRCGRFIAYEQAYRRMVTPDSHHSSEEFETLCPKHAPKPKRSYDWEWLGRFVGDNLPYDGPT